MPTNYTLFRYLGSVRTASTFSWTPFTQDGDDFNWVVPVVDTNATNPGTSAVTSTFTVPTGVRVKANIFAKTTNGSTGIIYGLLSDLSITDTAPTSTILNFGMGSTGDPNHPGTLIGVYTNTSSQARYRLSASAASDVVILTTMGWNDTRQKNA